MKPAPKEEKVCRIEKKTPLSSDVSLLLLKLIFDPDAYLTAIKRRKL